MNPADALIAIHARIDGAAQNRAVALVAASKAQPVAAIRALAAVGQRAFGENYVQEALAKQRGLAELNPADLALEWHMIGPLQSNKCGEVARHFDWLQSLDREKLIDPLDHARPSDMSPLNVLIEVNLDDEAGKSGCTPGALSALATRVAAARRLHLRGLMAIPAPTPDRNARRAAFARLRALFDTLRTEHPHCDTLSMGMSDDFELAIEEGATMVRIGTALFGSRAVNRKLEVGSRN
ncbi:MAG: YggS family pyridoxal phosphate-dependent enzyme [Rhodanobacteraceae bacterium]